MSVIEKELRKALEIVANGGLYGIAEQGCTWCLSRGKYPLGAVCTKDDVLLHRDDCPVAAALNAGSERAARRTAADRLAGMLVVIAEGADATIDTCEVPVVQDNGHVRECGKHGAWYTEDIPNRPDGIWMCEEHCRSMLSAKEIPRVVADQPAG